MMLVNANSLAIPLPAGAVHMICSSPPYWGLRDYGLATWKGGDVECDHKGEKRQSGDGLNARWGNAIGSAKHRDDKMPVLGHTCPKCGAIRHDSGLGLEPLHDCLAWATGGNCGACYVCRMRLFAAECWRVLRDDGTLWLNLGDSYGSGPGRNDTSPEDLARRAAAYSTGQGTGTYKQPQATTKRPPSLKPKDLAGIPWRVALALQADGWYLRSDIIWAKPNPMPESVTDRPTKAHEYVFLFAKGQRKTRVVKLSDLDGERVHFFQNLGLQASCSGAAMICIRLATSILNLAQSEYDFSLFPLDSQVWNDCIDEGAGSLVGSHPVINRAAILSARFLSSDITTKDFLNKLYGLFVALTDGDNFLKSRILPLLSDAPSINGNRDTSVTIHHSGDVCEFDFIHRTIITQSSKGCRYYYDADAVREENTPAGKARIESSPGTGSGMSIGMNGQRYARLPTVGYVAAGRNRRTVWTVATQPYSGAHFATWPEALVEPMIKAGTSERGCCPECGKQWERVTIKGEPIQQHWAPGTQEKAIIANGKHGSTSVINTGYSRPNVTTGWQPTCDHYRTRNPEKRRRQDLTGDWERRIVHAHAPVKPAVTLDPFAGSGTTGVVARRLRRQFVGLDLSFAYLSEQARRRLQLDAVDAFTNGDGFPAGETDTAGLPLFNLKGGDALDPSQTAAAPAEPNMAPSMGQESGRPGRRGGRG